MYNKTKKYGSLRYFDTCYMHSIGGVSNRRWRDSLSMYYIDKKSCIGETLPIFSI